MGYKWKLIINLLLDIRGPYRIILPLSLIHRLEFHFKLPSIGDSLNWKDKQKKKVILLQKVTLKWWYIWNEGNTLRIQLMG